MTRRRTTIIGIGAFGHWVGHDQHLKQTFNRIITRRLPLTEDAVFVLMLFLLSQQKQHKHLFKAVRASKDIGGYSYFSFSPDIDLLEVRTDNSVVGYELKGLQKATRSIDYSRVVPKSRRVTSIKGMKPMTYYDGLDQALSYLINPVHSPISDRLPSYASIFDFVYLVHPEQEFANEIERDAFANLIRNCTPIGLIYVSHDRWREVVPPKPNPFLHQDLKRLFLQNLDAFETYKKFRLSLIQ